MWSLPKPSVESIRRFLKEQATLNFSYSAVGATATKPPAGYVVARTRIPPGLNQAFQQVIEFQHSAPAPDQPHLAEIPRPFRPPL